VLLGVLGLRGSEACVANIEDLGMEHGLLWRLRRAGPDADVAEESAADKRALYVVAVTFFLLAAYIGYEAIRALLDRDGPLTSPVGVVLSILSLVVMPVLAYAKQRTGQQMGSRVLVADAKETWVCSYFVVDVADRRWCVCSVRLVVGRPGRGARHAPRDRLAGLGDAGGGLRSRPRWRAS
jgi:hypothetical protein